MPLGADGRHVGNLEQNWLLAVRNWLRHEHLLRNEILALVR